MSKFRRILCPQCHQPLTPAQKPDGRIVNRCGCPGLEREQGGEDRDIESGALELGPEEDDDARK
jgi:hypothetical protein